MFSQRMVQQSMRRFASHPSSIARPSLLKLAALSAIATTRHGQSRGAVSTAHTPDPNIQTKTSQREGLTILESQRLNRPVSPHLSIYRPQITWYASGLNRITGSVLSGGLYVFATAYLVAPLMGWHFESASMAAAFASWPLAVKVGLKLTAAFPFTFHSFNSIRHLIWDLGIQFSNQQVIRTGWTVVGLSIISAAALAFM